MENSRSIHGNLRSSTQWKQRNYYFVELTLFYALLAILGLLKTIFHLLEWQFQ